MEDAVGAGEAYHGTGELTVFAVFIGESGGIEDASDLLIIFSVVAPLEPGFSSFDVEAKVDRFVLYRDPGVQEFCLGAIFQMDDGQCTLSKSFTVIFAEVDVVHVIVIQDQAGTVLMDFRHEFHLCGDPYVNTGQFSCKNADFVQGSTGFLSLREKAAGLLLPIIWTKLVNFSPKCKKTIKHLK